MDSDRVIFQTNRLKIYQSKNVWKSSYYLNFFARVCQHRGLQAHIIQDAKFSLNVKHKTLFQRTIHGHLSLPWRRQPQWAKERPFPTPSLPSGINCHPQTTRLFISDALFHQWSQYIFVCLEMENTSMALTIALLTLSMSEIETFDKGLDKSYLICTCLHIIVVVVVL